MAQGDRSKVPVAEITKHSSAEDCWVVVNGKVYDLSKVSERERCTGHDGK